ncbi:hypothetical protein F4805DRAFT_429870 [Annulohypoxylon moriforme]|nr:hypothetical protein F4805DRAFT_429870 [Annulohypoxylon moriforme]
MWNFRDMDDSVSTISEYSTLSPSDASDYSDVPNVAGYRTERQTTGAFAAQNITFNIGRIGTITYNHYECKCDKKSKSTAVGVYPGWPVPPPPAMAAMPEIIIDGTQAAGLGLPLAPPNRKRKGGLGMGLGFMPPPAKKAKGPHGKDAGGVLFSVDPPGWAPAPKAGEGAAPVDGVGPAGPPDGGAEVNGVGPAGPPPADAEVNGVGPAGPPPADAEVHGEHGAEDGLPDGTPGSRERSEESRRSERSPAPPPSPAATTISEADSVPSSSVDDGPAERPVKFGAVAWGGGGAAARLPPSRPFRRLSDSPPVSPRTRTRSPRTRRRGPL